MYVRRRIRLYYLLIESWVPVLITTVWSLAIVSLHSLVGFEWLVMPVLPVTLVGIAVSLYVAFRSASAYNRWWEARQAIGSMVVLSRGLVMQVRGLIYNETQEVPADVKRKMLYRHLAWVYAVAHMLRRSSRLKSIKHTRIFSHRHTKHEHASMHLQSASYLKFLEPQERASVESFNNPPLSIMLHQVEEVQELTKAGYLDSIRQTAVIELLEKIDATYGACERIKNTPFPRQIAHFGNVFTWILVFLLPLAFLDVFEAEAKRHSLSTIVTHRYIFTLVPFAALISWVFLMMEKVSESHEDPFEGGVNDVPLSAICRLIEIDVKQALQEEEIPPRLEATDDTLY